MLKIYHVPLTRSVRILWLANELRLAHEVVAMPFDSAQSCPLTDGAHFIRADPSGRSMVTVTPVAVTVESFLIFTA